MVAGVDAFKAVMDTMALAMAMATFELALVHGAVVVAVAVATAVAVSTSSTVAIVATGLVGALGLLVVADSVDNLLVDLPSQGSKFRCRGVDLVHTATLSTHRSMLIPQALLTFVHEFECLPHGFGGLVEHFSLERGRH